MKKLISIVIGFLLLSVFVTLHHETQTYDSPGDSGKQTLSMSAETLQRKNASDSKEHRERWWNIAFLFFGWPSGINAWAILATGGFIAWQSSETRRSAQATRDSVSAIHRQIEMARDKDRAKVTITAESLELLTGTGWAITGKSIIRNIGYTRAFNVRFETKLVWSKADETPVFNFYEPAANLDDMQTYLDVTAEDDPKRYVNALFYDSTRDQDWISDATYSEQIRFRMYIICRYETVGATYRRISIFDWTPANTPGIRKLIHSPYENTPAVNNFDKLSSGYWRTYSDREELQEESVNLD